MIVFIFNNTRSFINLVGLRHPFQSALVGIKLYELLIAKAFRKLSNWRQNECADDFGREAGSVSAEL
jgi:hypothetical protein